MSRPWVWSEAQDRVRELTDGRAVLVGAGAELELLGAARGATPGAGRLDFAGLLSRVDGLAGTLPDAEAGFDVHVVSDFQASALPARFNALIEGGDWPVTLHAVRRGEDNWSVESVSVADDMVVARIAGFAETGREVPVALRVEGVERDRVVVSVGPGARADVRLRLPEDVLDASEDLGVVVAVEADDALSADDVGRVVYRPRRSLPVAVVAPRTPAADYLAAAIEAADLPLAPAWLDADAPTGEWPRGTSLLVLVDPGRVPPPLARRIARLLAGGGGVLVTVGPRTERAGRVPVLEGALLPSPPGGASGGRVVIEDAGHPTAVEGWRDVTVARSLVAEDAGPGRTILALADGRPLLVEHRVGSGRLLVLHTALDRAWSSLVLRPVFVRFVADALGYLANDLGPLRAVAGEPVALPAAAVQVFDADGARVLGLGSTAHRPTARFPDAGFYSVRTPGRRTLLAVHLDPRESDLRPADPVLLARWREVAAAGRSATASRPSVAAPDADVPPAWPLAPWLLTLLAVLLLAEPTIANLGGTFRRIRGPSADRPG